MLSIQVGAMKKSKKHMQADLFYLFLKKFHGGLCRSIEVLPLLASYVLNAIFTTVDPKPWSV